MGFSTPDEGFTKVCAVAEWSSNSVASKPDPEGNRKGEANSAEAQRKYAGVINAMRADGLKPLEEVRSDSVRMVFMGSDLIVRSFAQPVTATQYQYFDLTSSGSLLM